MKNSTRVCSVHCKEAGFKTTLTGKRALESMQFRLCFVGQDHPGKKNLRKRENHHVHECDYLIETCHRPLPLTQVNIVVRISLNIPWLKS